MKAVVVEQPGPEATLHIREVPAPDLGPGRVRIRVAATAVNRADLLQRQGLYPPPPGVSSLLGLECAGHVEGVGAGVEGFSPGDRVMALLAGGGYAEQAVVDAGSVLPVPERLSLEEAAALPEVFLTAFLNLFDLGGLSPGGSALVHGGGSGVGTASIQLAKQAGATIFVTAGSDEKCKRCRELGADHAIAYRSEDFAARVREATQGRGVDVVLDSIGAAYLDRNLDCLAIGGRLVVIGLMRGASAEINLAKLLGRRLQLIGSTLRSRSEPDKARLVSGFLGRFGEALRDGRIGPVIDRVLALEQVDEGHRAMKASEHFGKIVLRVS